MLNSDDIKLLGLSRKEARVLGALREGADTPLLLARATRVSRPGVYDILRALRERGLVRSRIANGRKHWELVSRRELDERFYETKKALLALDEGERELYGVGDAAVIIHRGVEVCRKVVQHITDDHKNERLYGFQSDVAANNWNHVFTLDDTNHFNKMVKKNGLIVEVVIPAGWFERQTKELGVEWAQHFEGRAARTTIVGEEYFRHGGQVFLFKESIYLIALHEELIIEVRNSEIQKMLLAFFRFMQEHSRAIDANALLRKLIAAGDGTTKK